MEMWAHLKGTFFELEITSQYFLFMCFFEHIYSSYVRNQCLTFDLVLDFVKIQNFGWKYGNVSTSQVDFFWTGNYIPILSVYVFLQTYLLKLCQESMLDIWPSSGLCKNSKLRIEIWKCEHISSGLFLDWKLHPNTSCLCVSSNIFTQVMSGINDWHLT